MLYIGRRLASRLGRGLASVCEGHSSLTHGPYFSPPPSLLSTLGPLLHRAHYNTTATTTSTTMAQVAPIPKSKVSDSVRSKLYFQPRLIKHIVNLNFKSNNRPTRSLPIGIATPCLATRGRDPRGSCQVHCSNRKREVR